MEKLPWINRSKNLNKLKEPIKKLNEILRKSFNRDSNLNHVKYLIDVASENSFDSIEKRSLDFFINSLAEKQNNLESIISKSIKYLPVDKPKSKEFPEREWVLDFFDLSQNCSEPEIQEIWAKLLADKVDDPNAHSRRLMHTIKLLDVKEAITFNNMAKCFCEIKLGSNIEELDDFGVNFGTVWVAGANVIIDDEIFDIDYNICLTLEEIGLVSNKEYFNEDDFLREIAFIENNEIKAYKLKEATISIFEFTKIGYELFEITGHELNSKYKEIIIENLRKKNMLK